MSFLIRLILAVLVVAIALHQAVMYFNIVVAGTYLSTAPIHLAIITGGLWPLLIVVITCWLLWKIFIHKLNQRN